MFLLVFNDKCFLKCDRILLYYHIDNFYFALVTFAYFGFILRAAVQSFSASCHFFILRKTFALLAG